MKTQIFYGAIVVVGIIIIILLCKYSVNKEEWFSSFHYPNERGEFLIQDYDTKKFQVATYDDGWYFKGAKPQHFKWRKLDC